MDARNRIGRTTVTVAAITMVAATIAAAGPVAAWGGDRPEPMRAPTEIGIGEASALAGETLDRYDSETPGLPDTLASSLRQAGPLRPVADSVGAGGLVPAGTAIAGASSGDVDGTVAVAVHVDPARGAAVRAAMEATGATVTFDAGGTIFADVAPDQATLAAIGAVAGVRYVEPEPVAERSAGPVTTEGLAGIGAGAWHTAGITGAGIDIAIVDTGFAGFLARQAAGDLPAGSQLVTQSFCPVFEADSHGTAVAEIVHDVSPGARLHLICALSLSELLQAKDYILNPPTGSTSSRCRSATWERAEAAIATTTETGRSTRRPRWWRRSEMPESCG